ncbi:MAG: ABC transporter ATP-binding protein [Thermodesulfovibrio sp.]|nr:ABC transporter ATP-binding protein [Thermodesulfovibrio sp.]
MIAIDVRDVRKIYRIYKAPADRLKEIVLRRSFHSEFVALDTMSFSVPQGSTFGIIGENGAGKSTLMKLLAKTLKPTSGSVTMVGRVAALLELGAGFNPELTGDENIYLNAYLMGLTKDEIDERKQQIIDFSELGDSIFRPVKTYSSGMYVRLAFSIATSVNPDILIIDEALSVGDQHFQKKCIDRMIRFKDAGKTIVFCSHSLYHVQELCQTTLWIDQGKTRMIGKTGAVTTHYQNFVRAKDEIKIDKAEAKTDSPIMIKKMTVVDSRGQEITTITEFQDIFINLEVSALEPTKGHLAFALMRNDQETCYATGTHFDGYQPITFRDGMHMRIGLPHFCLLNGLYFFSVALADDTGLHPYHVASSPHISVLNQKRELGIFHMEHTWEI